MTGYLDYTEKDFDKDGNPIIIAYYSDQDGGEAGHLELDIDDKVPETYEFNGGWDWDDGMDR